MLCGCLPAFGFAAEEPSLIPAPLNSALPRIKSSMTAAEAQAQLTNAYPKLRASLGVWSGQTGYIDFRLDDRYTISFAAHNPASGVPTEATAILNQDLHTYVFDHQTKHRLEISHYDWSVSPPPEPGRRKQTSPPPQ